MKLALVTGGTKGIGKAISDTLSNRYEVVTVGRSSDAIEQGDLSDMNFVNHLTNKYIPDLFVNNAAMISSDIEKSMLVNAYVPVTLMTRFYDKMNNGIIINISSISAEFQSSIKELPMQTAYSLSKKLIKEASLGLSYSKNRPVKVMCLSPARTETDTTKSIFNYTPTETDYINYDWYNSVCWTRPKEIADIVNWMIDLPEWINIPEIVLDNHYSKGNVW